MGDKLCVDNSGAALPAELSVRISTQTGELRQFVSMDATCGMDAGDPYCAPARKRPYLNEVGKDVKGLKIGFITSIPEGWHLETEIHHDCRRSRPY